ncbi:hypothetical protein DL95DRAFT_344790 [Leptodontidium sp. 2 PMI_412]|nr:hypothetical protein DL95DRAFT_344790 [Leptodontidium sp. 2 PMI_412]
MASFAQSLAIESWTLYAIGLILIAMRLASRRIQLGAFDKFQLDDHIMILVTLTFTGVIVSTNQVANNGSNYLPPGEAELLTEPEIVSAIWGSKMTFVLEEFTLSTTWLIKGCLLLLYGRLTLGLKQNTAVKFLAYYCLLGFVVVQVLFLGVWCRPIQQYWAVPVVNSQCATYYNHMITATTFNISSDLMMLLIPLPLLIKSKLPLKRKLIVCGVFSLGIFVILAAILNRYFNFTVAYSPIFLNWYVGEVSTAVFVANIPLCWPLIRRIFALDTFGGSKRSRSNDQSRSHLQSSSKRIYARNTRRSVTRLHSRTESNVGFGESEERIARTWTPQPEGHLELNPMEKKTGFKTSVVAGSDVEEGKDEWTSQETITKTVQISQYSV